MPGALETPSYQQGQVTFTAAYDVESRKQMSRELGSDEAAPPYSQISDAKGYKINKGEALFAIKDENGKVRTNNRGAPYVVSVLNGAFRDVSAQYNRGLPENQEIIKAIVSNRITYLGISNQEYVYEQNKKASLLVNVQGMENLIANGAIGVGDFVEWAVLTPKEDTGRVSDRFNSHVSRTPLVFRSANRSSSSDNILNKATEMLRNPEGFAKAMGSADAATDALTNFVKAFFKMCLTSGICMVGHTIDTGILTPTLSSAGYEPPQGRNKDRENARNLLVEAFAGNRASVSNQNPADNPVHHSPFGMLKFDGNDRKDMVKDDCSTGIMLAMAQQTGLLNARNTDLSAYPGSWTSQGNPVPIKVTGAQRILYWKWTLAFLRRLCPRTIKGIDFNSLAGFNPRTHKNSAIDQNTNAIQASTPLGKFINLQLNVVSESLAAYHAYQQHRSSTIVGVCTRGAGQTGDIADVFCGRRAMVY